MPNIHKLPIPVIESYEWQYEGSCAHLDSDTFFSPDAERGAKRIAREENAKSICRTCPVIERCRQHALETREPYGVWGGMTAGERMRLIERRIAS